MIEIINNGITFKFREPEKIVYALVTEQIAKEDYFEAVDILVKNCEIVEEGKPSLESDYQLSHSMAGEIITKVFSLYTVDIDINYTGVKYKSKFEELKKEYGTVFAVTIKDDNLKQPYVLFLKGVTREHYKAIFNKSIKGTMVALDYIYNELKVGGDDISTDNKAYASCMRLSDYLLSYKSEDLKKK